MEKEVNSALVAKKMYVSPLSEVLSVDPAAMVMVGSPTPPDEPGSAPRRRVGGLW